jgi:hypothetical protein
MQTTACRRGLSRTCVTVGSTMVSRHDRALLAAVVGTLLVLNPLWAFPHGGGAKLTYEYRAEPVDALPSAVLEYDEHAAERRAILRCRPGGVDDRLCVFERRVGPNGTLRVPLDSAARASTVDGRLNYPYEFVSFGGSAFYRPRATVSNGSVALSFERVSAETVAEWHAVPATAGVVPDAVRRALDDGAATATITVGGDSATAERRRERYEKYGSALVERDGEYYRVRYSGPHRRPVVPGWALSALRALAVAVGLGLAFYAVQTPERG